MELSTEVNKIAEVLNQLESKKKEAERFIAKYKTRQMHDLEEYYKGVKWALEYSIKIIKDITNPTSS